MLADYFQGVELSDEPIPLTSWSTIVNPQLFINSHLNILRNKNRNDRQYSLHLERLIKLKNLLETGELQDNFKMKRILVLDIETTGFLKDDGSIVEIGIVELNLDTGEVTEIYDSVCREEMLRQRHRDGWIFKNSSLTVEEVRNAPSFVKVKQEVQNIINRYPLGATAFNNKFDFDFLKNRGITFLRELPCPMKIATPICNIPFANGKGTKWPNVEEAYAHFFPDVEYKELHRGLDDAKHEAQIVYELYKMGHFKID